MRWLHTITTTEWSADGREYDGRTFGITVLGFRVCVFAGHRHRLGTVEQEFERGDEIADAARHLGRLHRGWPS